MDTGVLRIIVQNADLSDSITLSIEICVYSPDRNRIRVTEFLKVCLYAVTLSVSVLWGL